MQPVTVFWCAVADPTPLVWWIALTNSYAEAAALSDCGENLTGTW